MITRCICFSQSFEDLKRIAKKHNAHTIAELQEHVRFGLNCQLCHPYVKAMLRTGQTEFTEILIDSDDESPDE